MADRLTLALPKPQPATFDANIAYVLIYLVAGFLFFWAMGTLAPVAASLIAGPAGAL